MIIDFHVHVFPDEIAPRAVARFAEVDGIQPLSDGTLAGTLKYMDASGVDIIVPQPVATKPSQVTGINDWVFSIRSSQVVPFGAIHPEFTHIPSEIDRLVGEGIRGIKLQPAWQGFHPDDESAFPLYEAAEGRLAILFHSGKESDLNLEVMSTPSRLRVVHEKFPGLTIIAAHMGGFRMWDDADEKLYGKDLYIDSSCCWEQDVSDDEYVAMLRKHGVDKVLFASDFPFGDPAKDIERLKRLPLSDDEYNAITWKNAAGLLGLE